MRESKIYKVVHQISRIDDTKLPKPRVALIARARKLSKAWVTFADIHADMLLERLTPPTYSQQVLTQDEAMLAKERDEDMLLGWKWTTSSPPL